MFGAGCWAERLTDGSSIACSVSGQGELIMQSSIAKTLAERIAANAAAEGDTHDVLRSVLVDHFYSALRTLDLVCAFRDTSPAPKSRQVASTGRASASGGCTSPYPGRGREREH